DYLNREEDEEDGYTNLVDKSLQTTRRFDALKVWMSFQARGKKRLVKSNQHKHGKCSVPLQQA
ncbi:hypothetical protein, partial [Treponema sp.]|uniref:hypothetical protein n=1 Tax=Treponema sp. TaxID=166 RepID=UPI002A7FC871